MRPTVGVRDQTKPKHSEDWFPGDRRIYKGAGEEAAGDYGDASEYFGKNASLWLVYFYWIII